MTCVPTAAGFILSRCVLWDGKKPPARFLPNKPAKRSEKADYATNLNDSPFDVIHRLKVAFARPRFANRFWVYLAVIVLAIALLWPMLSPRFDFDGSEASSTSITIGPMVKWRLTARRMRYPQDKVETYGWMVWIGPVQVRHLEHGVTEGNPPPGYTRILKVPR